jgi:hypothetical protein
MTVRAQTLGKALLITLLSTAAPASAADLLGANVTGTLLFPDIDTPYAGQQSVTTVVDGDIEFQSGFFGAPGSIDVGANTITFATNYGGTYGSGDYNGYRLDFEGLTIKSLTLNQSSTFTPLDFSFNGSSVFFNVQGQTANNGSAFFDVEVGAPVPEPSTWAMMLLGFGFVGGAMRSRRRQKVTVSYA